MTTPTTSLVAALRRAVDRVWQWLMGPSAVVCDPDIRGGEPVVRGTRVPVYRLADLRAQGVSDQVLLEEHPSLTRDSLSAALRYARRHPRPPVAQVVSRRTLGMIDSSMEHFARGEVGPPLDPDALLRLIDDGDGEHPRTA
jgi:uncharacterized protein (DUF433 family)